MLALNQTRRQRRTARRRLRADAVRRQRCGAAGAGRPRRRRAQRRNGRFDRSAAAALRRGVRRRMAAQRRAPPREYHFDPSPDMLALLRARTLGATGRCGAARGRQRPRRAREIVSAAGSGLRSEPDRRRPAARRCSHDLEGVRYIEIPWLADPDSPGLADVPHANFSNPVLERLYALGLDAFALAQMLAEPVPPERIELDGATGHLSLTWVPHVCATGPSHGNPRRTCAARLCPAISARRRAPSWRRRRGPGGGFPARARPGRRWRRNYRCRRGRDRPDCTRRRHAGVRRSPAAQQRCVRRRGGEHHCERSAARIDAGRAPLSCDASAASRVPLRCAFCSTRSILRASNGCATSRCDRRAARGSCYNRACPSAVKPSHGYAAHPRTLRRQRRAQARCGRHPGAA